MKFVVMAMHTAQTRTVRILHHDERRCDVEDPAVNDVISDSDQTEQAQKSDADDDFNR